MEDIEIIHGKNLELSPCILKLLLIDKTTKKYICWATDNYISYGSSYVPEHEIEPDLISGYNIEIIQPRVTKAYIEQIKRTRSNAEVFTPLWVCNQQNNLIDEAWFERQNVFNITVGNRWITNRNKIEFHNKKNWKKYVDARRLEVSCGEGPYLTTRYDPVSGEPIILQERIGILDRKLRVVNENVKDDNEWFKWVLRAYQSVYGYDYQGDNIVLARKNLFHTFMDNYMIRFGHKPTFEQQKKLLNIITWNIWQMDGITLTTPYSNAKSDLTQLSFLHERTVGTPMYSRIFDWRANKSLEYCSLTNRR